MWDKYVDKSEAYLRSKVAIATVAALMASGTPANALSADDVLNKMTSDQQTAYVAGVVGGLAYSRFLQDRPDTNGMACINNWYYGSGTAKWDLIETWFARHLDKQAEPLLYVLIKRECGE